jgi:hypothetical protein
MRHRQPRQERDGGFEIVEPLIHGDVRRIGLALRSPPQRKNGTRIACSSPV